MLRSWKTTPNVPRCSRRWKPARARASLFTTFLEKNHVPRNAPLRRDVLRISRSRATVGVLLLGMLQPILAVLIAALVLSAIFARRLSRRIVEPLNNLDLDHPLDNDAYEELCPSLAASAASISRSPHSCAS